MTLFGTGLPSFGMSVLLQKKVPKRLHDTSLLLLSPVALQCIHSSVTAPCDKAVQCHHLDSLAWSYSSILCVRRERGSEVMLHALTPYAL